MSNIANNLLLLFERPNEPIFTPKGDGNKIIEVPDEYLSKGAADLKKSFSLSNRAGVGDTEKITVTPIPNPNLPLPEKLDKNAKFSTLIPLHQEMAEQVIEYLLDMRNMEDFASAAVYFRANLNPLLFNYALSVAMLHKKETQNENLFTLNEVFPEKFHDGDVVYRAMVDADITEGQQVVIDIKRDYTGSDLDEEHRLAYFREDIGINLHHWHWHLVYPLSPVRVATKDRRGELFFYMHQQVIARYNMERLCNRLQLVKKITNLKDPIPEAYFSKLTGKQSSMNWPGRGSNAVLQDIRRPVERNFSDLETVDRWRSRLYEAIDLGYVINRDGEKVKLTEKGGIDILGNMVEASSLSINKPYYGNFHNTMHMLISYVHDPDYRHLEPFSVMGASETAMRDPVFYRVHKTVDDIFQTYKSTLPGYTIGDLDFSSVTVTDLSVQVEGEDENSLFTYFQEGTTSLTRGLDFIKPTTPVSVKFIHLQHKPFTYTIEVENKGSKRKGTVRIFIAPKFDESGQRMEFTDQRKLFVELDRFVIDLNSGKQTIYQKSEESSVTIPFDRTYRDLDSKRPDSEERASKFNFCGCGWPHNMLIAKGTELGYPCELFVMISNFADDEVEQDLSEVECKEAMSYCGIRNKKYPDARAMGFPFDRDGRDGVKELSDFLRRNMKVTDVKIFHKPT